MVKNRGAKKEGFILQKLLPYVSEFGLAICDRVIKQMYKLKTEQIIALKGGDVLDMLEEEKRLGREVK